MLVVLLGALAVAWSVGPLARGFDPRVVAGFEQRLRDWPLAPLVVIAAHVALGLVAAPATLLIGATVLLFGAWPGSAIAFAGMLANAAVVYAIGRFAARDVVDRWLARRAGSRLDLLDRRLAQRGLVAIALIRLTPVPYTLVNALAGASRIGFRDFVCGTALGIVPVIALLAGVATTVDAWLADPDWRALPVVAGVAFVVVAVGWSLRRWLVERDERR